MKQNILIVHNYYQVPGGEDTVVANEKRILEEQGHKVIFFSRSNKELNQLNKLQKLMLPVTTLFNLDTFLKIRTLIKVEKIEIVHVHNTLNLISPSVYYAALSMNIPVVQTIHNFRLICPGATLFFNGKVCEDCITNGLWCAIKRRCYRNSFVQTLACVISISFHRFTKVYRHINYICLTDFNRQKLLSMKQIDPSKVFVKPNFVESTSEFKPSEERHNEFAYVGRLDKLKGIELLFNAWKQLEEKEPEFDSRLVVCGTGPMEQWCKDFIQENGLKRIEMRGFVPNDIVRKIIANAKALILPTQWYEGFPMTIVEAYSVGTPVLGSNIGNVGSLIYEGETGYCFQHNDLQDLCNKVLTCDFAICSQTKAYFENNYTKDKNYELLIDCYRRSQR